MYRREGACYPGTINPPVAEPSTDKQALTLVITVAVKALDACSGSPENDGQCTDIQVAPGNQVVIAQEFKFEIVININTVNAIKPWCGTFAYQFFDPEQIFRKLLVEPLLNICAQLFVIRATAAGAQYEQ